MDLSNFLTRNGVVLLLLFPGACAGPIQAQRSLQAQSLIASAHRSNVPKALAAAVPDSKQSFDGIWNSDGYGLSVEVQGTKMTVFQTTSISCTQWWTANRTSGSPNQEVFDRGDANIRLATSSSPDAIEMWEGTSISYITLRRVPSLPKTCREKFENTPANTYAVFWQTFAEQFALFPAYQVDWNAVDRQYRPKVTASTTPPELFDILRAMILPFHNAHTNINAESIGRGYIGARPASDIGRKLQSTSTLSFGEILGLFQQEAQRSQKIVETRYSVKPLQPYANGMIQFGMLKNSIGYMSIMAFDGYTQDGNVAHEAAALEDALDNIFRNSGQMKGLIIDVRVNAGGADPLALAVASRLTDVKYLAYSKVARDNANGHLHFTARQPIWVNAPTHPSYRGKVVLLIGPETVSGGEAFAMALMGRTPKIRFVGENTQGVFSDVWGRKLPNGWTFGVPTELYLTKSGTSFDVRGIPPDIRIPVFSKADLDEGRDRGLEAAIRVISGTSPETNSNMGH